METIGAIIVWAVFGLIVGLIARAIMPGRQAMGLAMTMVLGIIGSLAGGLITWIVTGANDPYQASGFIMSLIGAIIVLAIAGMVTRRREVM